MSTDESSSPERGGGPAAGWWRGPRDPHRGRKLAAPLLLLLALAPACKAQQQTSPFPDPQRPVAPIVSSRYSNEDARDGVGEFERVVALAEVKPGMSVADIGAGEGYYTIRLSPLVGPDGRVLAQDIVPATRDALAERVTRERLDNVAVKLGLPNDPKLPAQSFDRVFLVHMYHEIERPSEFLWHLRDSLRRGGRVVVVDADRPTNRHGTPPRLLVCEFTALGYGLTRFETLPDKESYYAQFEATAPRPEAGEIKTCPA